MAHLRLPKPRRTLTRGMPARALGDLRYIRATIESASSFTALSGWGQVVVGVTALAAALVAARQASVAGWILVWSAEAVLAGIIAFLTTARKAERAGTSVLSGPGRRFVLSFLPPMAVGALLTLWLYRAGATSALPGTWMLLYGAGVITGGAFSVRVVPAMGIAFMMAGAMSLFAPTAWADALMALTFGGLHLAFGFYIARRHGG